MGRRREGEGPIRGGTEPIIAHPHCRITTAVIRGRIVRRGTGTGVRIRGGHLAGLLGVEWGIATKDGAEVTYEINEIGRGEDPRMEIGDGDEA